MIKINQGYWCPVLGRIIGVFCIAGLALSFAVSLESVGSFLIRGIVLIFCVMLITSRNFLVINARDNTYFEYLWALGFKFGTTTKFDSIEKLFINKITLVTDTYKYSMVVLPNATKVRTSVYKCFVKFGNGEKILLDSDEDKDKLILRLKAYNKILKVPLYDTTAPEATIVE